MGSRLAFRVKFRVQGFRVYVFRGVEGVGFVLLGFFWGVGHSPDGRLPCAI